MKTTPTLMTILFLTASAVLFAATPPALINYQGVLRDTSGAPRTGSFDMTFRFYDLDTGGSLLLTDTHAGAGAVAVANGLFSAQLGGGAITPGSEPNLAEVFRDNAAVWLEVQIAPDLAPMTPRVRILASAYALNADTLDGVDSSAFLTAETDPQVGTLTANQWCRADGTATAVQCTASAPADGDWTVSGSNLYSAVSGNVGIGTSSPGAKLHVSAPSAVELRVENTTYDVGQSAALKFMHNTRYAGIESHLPGDNDVDLRFITTDNSTPATAMTIIGNGLVGIGTSTPTGRFEVAQHIGTQDVYSDYFNNYACIQADLWQSFTAGRTGNLVRLSGRVASDSSKTGVVRIYSGEGVGGTLLATGSIDIPEFAQAGFRTCVFSDPPAVSAGSQYTFRITAPSWFYLYGDPTNPYPGGRISCDAGADGQFLTYVGSGTKETSLFVDPLTGQIGLGTSAPSNRLHVVGTASVSENLGVGTATPGYKLDVNGNMKLIGAFHDSSGDAGTSGQVLSSTGAATNWVNPANDGDWTISGSNMYSAVSGKVGIGTATPVNKMDVEGAAAIGATYSGTSTAPANGLIVEGNVGIGTAAPAAGLHVIGSGWFGADSGGLAGSPEMGIRIFTDSGATPNIGRIYGYDYGALSALNLNLQQNGGNVSIGGITPSYQLQLSSNSAAKPLNEHWTVPSDMRLKKDIASFTDGLEVLAKIRPIRYKLNGLAGLPQDAEGIGILAQEMKQIAPYTVGSFKTKLRPTDVQETELLDFNGSALTYVMINAIKELDERTKGLAGKEAKAPVTREMDATPRAFEAKAELEATGGTSDGAFQPAGPTALLEVSPDVRAGEVLVIVPDNGAALHPCYAPADPMVVGIAIEGAVEGWAPVAVSGIALGRADATLFPISKGDLLTTSANPGHAMKAVDPKMGTVVGKALEDLPAGTGLIRVLVMLR